MAEKDFVKLKNVTKIYQMGEVQIRAVDGIDFSIDKGEFVVVVGPSGAGKTTVLNILGGMDKASGGEVLVDGKDIAGYSQKQLTGYRRNDIGFVFQFYNLVPNLTALENVELALQISRNPLDAKTVMQEVGLGDRLNNFPAQLSVRVSDVHDYETGLYTYLDTDPEGVAVMQTIRSTGKLEEETETKLKEVLGVYTKQFLDSRPV